MGRTRKAYAPEFRRRMVELVRAGRSPEQLAKEFEPSANAIRIWAQQADRDEGRRSDGLTTPEREVLCGILHLMRWMERRFGGSRPVPSRYASWGDRAPGAHIGTDSWRCRDEL